MPNPTDPTQRFSTRVADYVKYRPSYPPEVLSLMERECGLTSSSVIADAGSGTGILTELLLKHGNPVFAIEPNAEMRAAAEQLLGRYVNFTSVAATAEETGLPDASVDFVVAAQAFHWFDHEKARAEFRRILRPDGWVVLVWNTRRSDTSPFLVEYEQMLKTYGTDYEQVAHRHDQQDELTPFFAPNTYSLAEFENSQYFDFEGLKGRLLSSSYAPQKGHPSHESMLAELRRIFDRHNVEGKVRFEYDTQVYYGQL